MGVKPTFGQRKDIFQNFRCFATGWKQLGFGQARGRGGEGLDWRAEAAGGPQKGRLDGPLPRDRCRPGSPESQYKRATRQGTISHGKKNETPFVSSSCRSWQKF